MTHDELTRRIANTRRALEWANGEYAEQLGQDLAYYQRLLDNLNRKGS